MRSEGDRGQSGSEGQSISAIVAAAHELKSPLVLIRQLAFVAADTDASEAERRQALDQLRATADRGLRLTTDLTRTVRLEDSLFAIEPVNAQQLCDEVARHMTPLYTHYGRSISTDIRRARSPILAHRELLTSVLYHFADNALHYGDGNSSVSLSMQEKASQGIMRIGVRDVGPAMSLREWRVARKHPQGSLASRPQGSGLGLHISEQFAAAMGGRIGLTRHRDGVTFYIELPLSEQLSLL